ncbi:MAG: DUF502 domain-containing protein [Alphaproteobacteria bacterium]|nr:DUF502 domain-containing protein [Alphaproteobacteria bacterium]
MSDNKDKNNKKENVFTNILLRMKAYLFTGILVTAPVTITFYMVYKLIAFIDVSVGSLISHDVQLSAYFPFNIPGVGLLFLITILIIIGMFTTGYIGNLFVRLGEYIVSKMPFISSVYSLLKQVFETFFSSKKQSFNQVVLLEYPRKGLWVIGFVSAQTTGEVAENFDTKMLNVFVPTTPNPTSGFLIFVPQSDVIKLDMSVEDGLKFVISCGIVTPDMVNKKSKNAD